MNWPEPVDDPPGLAGGGEGGFAGAVLVWARAGRATTVATRAAVIKLVGITTSWERQRSVSVTRINASPANRFKALHREIQSRKWRCAIGAEVPGRIVAGN